MKIYLIIFLFLSSLGICSAQNQSDLLRAELIAGLAQVSDSVYISDRRDLEKIGGHGCSHGHVEFSYTSKSKEQIKISIESSKFDPAVHEMDISRNFIDGRISYGIDRSIPTSEIKSLFVEWNGNELVIPDLAYSNLYQPHLCEDYLVVEAYLSAKSNNLFIYVSGSDGAGGYSVKFIFDKMKYVTQIVGTNESMNGFDFIDCLVKDKK